MRALQRTNRVRIVDVRDIFCSRDQFGDEHNLLSEMPLDDQLFFTYTRMNVERQVLRTIQ